MNLFLNITVTELGEQYRNRGYSVKKNNDHGPFPVACKNRTGTNGHNRIPVLCVIY